MTAEQGFLDIRSRIHPPKDAGGVGSGGAAADGKPALGQGKVFRSGGKIYTLIEGKGYDGLW
jgi:hypothetical protein